MNKRTAAIILNDDVRVIHARYRHTGSRNRGEMTQLYTFFTSCHWVPDTVEKGDWLVAQAASFNQPVIVQFDSWGTVDEIDIDDETITYKFVVGVVSPEYMQRIDQSESSIKRMESLVTKHRVALMRAQIAEVFGLDAPPRLTVGGK